MLNIRNSELLTVPCTRLSQRSRQRWCFFHIPVSLSVRFPMTVFSATFWTIDFIVAFFVGYYVSGSLEPWYTLVKVVAQWDKYCFHWWLMIIHDVLYIKFLWLLHLFILIIIFIWFIITSWLYGTITTTSKSVRNSDHIRRPWTTWRPGWWRIWFCSCPLGRIRRIRSSWGKWWKMG